LCHPYLLLALFIYILTFGIDFDLVFIFAYSTSFDLIFILALAISIFGSFSSSPSDVALDLRGLPFHPYFWSQLLSSPWPLGVFYFSKGFTLEWVSFSHIYNPRTQPTVAIM